ncbi:glycerophosphodiester phosphodiesterase [Cohnella cellulosilytica]|uniref:Glycerophosphodiester phosphodiesterase n=1 Tax=Cohnella cellulosilytica TaxID=986710 RepID=A0ABW2F1U7_9BACL
MVKKPQEPLTIPKWYFYTLHLMLLSALGGLAYLLSAIPLDFPGLFLSDEKIVTVAHRGASGYAPESTLSSYRLGVKMKADYIEIDVQMTADGELIAMHDKTVDRTTNGTGSVKKMTLAQIKALDAGSWFNEKHPIYARDDYVNERVPTLREIFEAFGKDTRYMLETKDPEEHPGMEEKMWALVEEFDLRKHVAVQSFSRDSLMKIREWDKDVPLFQLLWYNRPARISERALDEIAAYANGIGANYLRIDEGYVDRVKQAGLLIYPYTVNYQVNMENAVKWGVDGVHTDFPDRFLEVIEELDDPEV